MFRLTCGMHWLIHGILLWQQVKALSCPCEDQQLCNPIPFDPNQKQVFAFATDPENHFEFYDWKRMTTLCLFGKPITSEIMCLAHYHNVKVVTNVNFPTSDFFNQNKVDRWIEDLIEQAKDTFSDGLNIDFEEPIPKDSKLETRLTEIVQQLYVQFKRVFPKSQISFDVAWSPKGIDKRYYNVKDIAKFIDLFFVMSYDTRSQVFELPCTAGSNSPVQRVTDGIQAFNALGIHSDKLILGLPWYGYDYPCLSNDVKAQYPCRIKKIPFRGAKCSDAAGVEVPIHQLEEILKQNQTTSPVFWDKQSQTPYFNYMHKNDGQMHQVWFDNVQSLEIKYNMAKKLNLIGIGMWNIDLLDYSQSGMMQRMQMFAALDSFLRNVDLYPSDTQADLV